MESPLLRSGVAAAAWALMKKPGEDATTPKKDEDETKLTKTKEEAAPCKYVLRQVLFPMFLFCMSLIR